MSYWKVWGKRGKQMALLRDGRPSMMNGCQESQPVLTAEPACLSLRPVTPHGPPWGQHKQPTLLSPGWRLACLMIRKVLYENYFGPNWGNEILGVLPFLTGDLYSQTQRKKQTFYLSVQDRRHRWNSLKTFQIFEGYLSHVIYSSLRKLQSN